MGITETKIRTGKLMHKIFLRFITVKNSLIARNEINEIKRFISGKQLSLKIKTANIRTTPINPDVILFDTYFTSELYLGGVSKFP